MTCSDPDAPDSGLRLSEVTGPSAIGHLGPAPWLPEPRGRGSGGRRRNAPAAPLWRIAFPYVEAGRRHIEVTAAVTAETAARDGLTRTAPDMRPAAQSGVAPPTPPEKRKVGGSTPPLATPGRHARRPRHLRKQAAGPLRWSVVVGGRRRSPAGVHGQCAATFERLPTLPEAR